MDKFKKFSTSSLSTNRKGTFDANQVEALIAQSNEYAKSLYIRLQKFEEKRSIINGALERAEETKLEAQQEAERTKKALAESARKQALATTTQAEKDARTLKANAIAEANDMLAKAEKESKDLLAVAHQKHDEIINTAVTNAKAIATEIEKQVKSATRTYNQLKTLSFDLNQVQSELNNLLDSHDWLNSLEKKVLEKPKRETPTTPPALNEALRISQESNQNLQQLIEEKVKSSTADLKDVVSDLNTI